MSLIFIIVGVIVFLFLSREHQFYIFSLSAFFQFTLGNLGFIPNFLLIEWITPLFLLILINELIPVYTLKKGKKLFDFRGVEIFIFAILLLIITASVSFGRNEIFPEQNFYIASSKGIKRTYYGIFNNILIFFTTIIYLSRYNLNIEKWIRLLLSTSVFLGMLRLAIYFLDIPFPFMAGGFDYNPGVSTRFGGETYRIGGLAEITLVGFSALFADFFLRKKINIPFAVALLFIQFLSGGRTILIGVVIAVTFYSSFFLKRSFFSLVILAAFGMITILLVVPGKVVEGQIGRMTAFGGGLEEQSSTRYIAHVLLLNNFQKDPIFGKGISDYHGILFSQNDELEEFIRSIQRSGGHGSYTSILGIFGIAGFLFLIIFTFGVIFLSVRKLKQYIKNDHHISSLLSFILLISIMTSVYITTSYNGFGISYLLFNAGLIVGLKVDENMNRFNFLGVK